MNHFIFIGFLPVKKGRQTLLKSLAEEKRTIVLYESPHRLIKTLTQLQEFLGDRRISIGRELTKIHEQFLRFSLSEAIAHYETTNPRGEYVLVVEGR